jgi:phospholipid/cholesterol/gamma-HCH transport system substrate-binding protein
MNTIKHIKLGLFVGAALFIGMLAVFILGENKNWFNERIHLKGWFKNAGGLIPGTKVRLVGITIGEVSGISIISDSIAEVEITIGADYAKHIKKNAALSIGGEGLVGSKVVNIVPGDTVGEHVRDGDRLPTYSALDTERLLENLQKISDNAAAITADMAALLSNVRKGKGPLGSLFTDSNLSREIKQTIRNLNKGSQKLDQNMEAAQNSFLLRKFFKKKEKDEHDSTKVKGKKVRHRKRDREKEKEKMKTDSVELR